MLKHPTTKQAQCRYGTFSFYEDDRYIGRALSRYGEYSEGEAQLYRKLIKPGDTVVEVGANIGALTLALADIVGSEGKVIAFEPQPENFALLVQNTKDNAFEGIVTAYSIGAGCAVSTARIPALTEVANHNYGGVEIGTGMLGVSVQPLDSRLTEVSPDFIKIDVEGMEADVLRGAIETIKKHRPLLYIENDRKDKSDELMRLIASLDYRMFEHKPLIYEPKNWNDAPIAPEDANIVSLNLLCIPTEKRREYESSTEALAAVYPPRQAGRGWVCIVRCGGIGDNLIAASVLRPLHAQGHKIEVISQQPQCVVFENNPFVDKLSVRAPGDLPTDFKLWGDYFRLRAPEFDKLINLSHSVEGLRALFDGSMAWDWPVEFRRKMCGESYLETAHDIAGVPHVFGPLFFPTEDEVDHARETIRKVSMHGALKVVGWCLAGSRLDKIYPMAPMAIARLIKEMGVAVIMFGAKDRIDFEMAQTVHEHIKVNNSTDANLHLALSPVGTDTWPIRRAITTLMHCDAVITPDSGLGWSVALESIPKIMLHSHASQVNITKHWKNTISMIPSVACWPCHKLHNDIKTCQAEQAACGMTVDKDAKGAACITSISVDDVLGATRNALALTRDHHG
jgi:FkbM family methyltransferase